MSNTISFMSANYVAREVGYAMHGWGHGDRATNEAFRPIETYAQRLDAILSDIRGLGFDAIDIWGAHLHPEWASDEQVSTAKELLVHHGLRVTSYAVWVGNDLLQRACEIASALGAPVIGGAAPVDDPRLPELLRANDLRLGIENHPERTPQELLDKTGGHENVGACIDTGWWGTNGYDAPRAIEELGDRVFHVHLKDVLAEGEPHETCRWGEGIVDIEGCVRALQRIGYTGAITVEHEPERFDPTDDVSEMRKTLVGWLA
jgi:L-ribulose-5-phosphate 3-epimerase